MTQKKPMEKRFNINDVKVRRTLKGTMLECATAIILLAAWAIILYFWFVCDDLRGKAYAIVGILLSAASAGALALAYHPKFIHVVSRFSSERQVLVGCEFVRVLALEAACMLLWTMLSVFMNVPADQNIFTIIIFATTIVYAIRMSKAR